MTSPPPALVQAVDLSEGPGGLTAIGDSAQWEWGTFEAPPGGVGWATGLQRAYRHNAADALWWSLPGGAEERWLAVDHAFAVSLGDRAEVLGELTEGALERLVPAYGYPAEAGFVGESDGFRRDWVRVPAGANAVGLQLVSDAAGSDQGWFVTRLELWDGDPVPPELLVLEAPGDTQDLLGPYLVLLQAQDQASTPEVTVAWSSSAGASGVVVAADRGGGTFQAELPGQPAGTTVSWSATASDGTNRAFAPLEGELSFRTFLAPPTDLRRLDAGRVAQAVRLGWEPPDSPHPVLRYELTGSALPSPVSAIAPPVDLPLAGPGEVVVRAAYAEGLGEPSLPLSLEVEVPSLVRLTPDQAFPGESWRASLELRSAYLMAGEVDLDLGPGLVLEDVAVLDVDRASFDLRIDPDAQPGPRDLIVQTPLVNAFFPAALVLGDPEDAPRVVRVAPAVVQQGAQVDLELTANVPWSASTRIVGDDDLLIVGSELLSSGPLSASLVVDARARLGAHRLTVEVDGRLLQAELEVVARPAVVLSTCGHGPGAPGGGALIACLGAAWCVLRAAGRPRS
jgi:hypothetical protein